MGINSVFSYHHRVYSARFNNKNEKCVQFTTKVTSCQSTCFVDSNGEMSNTIRQNWISLMNKTFVNIDTTNFANTQYIWN